MLPPVSKFELQDLGDGRFSLIGDMSFETAEQILRASEGPFEQHTRIEVDLSQVEKADSAGLALLLEWITWANHTVNQLVQRGLVFGQFFLSTVKACGKLCNRLFYLFQRFLRPGQLWKQCKS